MKNVHLVKVKPQPKRRNTSVLCVWNIFKWWSTVNPDDETTEDQEEDNYTAEQEDNDTAEQEEPEIGIEINLDIVWDDVLPYFE
jgi:hypothetical protein